jgi:Ca2+-binding RTX toxin-like protein
MAYVYGTANDDVIHGDDDDGSLGNDTLWGFGGNDRLYGHDGASDYLIGGEGADIIDGGAGADMTDYRDSWTGVVIDLATGRGYGGTAESDRLYSIEHVIGSNHNDTLRGTENHDFFDGSDGNDLLKGFGGADSLYGGNGDDTLKGGGGADTLHGGAGIDTAAYNDSPTRVFVSLLNNTATYGDAEGDTFTYIENVTGSAYNDDLWGHNGANAINGMAGNDRLKGYGGADTLHGETGDDVIDGGTGADTMIGGTGNDLYFVDSGSDLVTERGGEGIDTVRTSVSYSLPYNADVETLETTDANGTAAISLYGNASGNIIIGNNGSNIIYGGGGVDEMSGRGGNDSYYVDNANDRVTESGGQGNDTVRSSVTWTLTAGADVELVATDYDFGTAAINLTGNANGNVLRGNNGNNTLNGREGRDDLTGLGGQDQFLFNTPLSAATNVDRVTDFNVADDVILLEQAIFSSSLGLGNISAGEFVIGTAAQDANDRMIYDSNSGALFYDNDGVGGNAQVQFAELSRGLALTNLDFLVVSGTTQLPSLGGGTLPVTRAMTTDFAVDTTTSFSRTAPVEYIDLNQSLVHQDFYVW